MKLWLISFFMLSSSLLGLQNGNPSLPDMPEFGFCISNNNWWGIKVGYICDDTFEKRVKIIERSSSLKDRFDTYSSIKNIGELTFNVIDRFELYALLGSMRLSLTQRPTPTICLEYQTDQQLLWGAGGRVILVYWEEVVMGVNALFMGSHMKIDRIFQNSAPRHSHGARFKYFEWQLGISFSREIDPFIPYLGLAYSSMHSDLYHIPIDSSFRIEDESLKNRQPFILLLGIGLTNGYISSFNLECRLIGEKGVTFSGNIRF